MHSATFVQLPISACIRVHVCDCRYVGHTAVGYPVVGYPTVLVNFGWCNGQDYVLSVGWVATSSGLYIAISTRVQEILKVMVYVFLCKPISTCMWSLFTTTLSMEMPTSAGASLSKYLEHLEEIRKSKWQCKELVWWLTSVTTIDTYMYIHV